MDFFDDVLTHKLMVTVAILWLTISIILMRYFNKKYEKENRVAEERSAHFLAAIAAEQAKHAKLYSEHKNIERRRYFDDGPEISPEVARLLVESAKRSRDSETLT